MAKRTAARKDKPKNKKKTGPASPPDPPHQTAAQEVATDCTELKSPATMADSIETQEKTLARTLDVNSRLLGDNTSTLAKVSFGSTSQVSSGRSGGLFSTSPPTPPTKLFGSTSPSKLPPSFFGSTTPSGLPIKPFGSTSAPMLPTLFGSTSPSKPPERLFGSPSSFEPSEGLFGSSSPFQPPEKLFGSTSPFKLSPTYFTDLARAAPDPTSKVGSDRSGSLFSAPPFTNPRTSFADLVGAALASTSNIRPSPTSGLFSTSPSAISPPYLADHAEAALASTSEVSPCRSGGLFSTSPSALPSTSLFALSDTALVPSLDAELGQSNGPAPTLSPATKAPPIDVATKEIPAPGANFTGPFRLFDLAQELQDKIFELAYTEPNFRIVFKSMWESKQTHVRNTTGKAKVDFPTHASKVNEWMVSKKYFRAAAKAWVDAHTSLEFVRSQMKGGFMDMDERFPPMFDMKEGAGLFREFGRAFVVDLYSPETTYISRLSQCRRVQNIIYVVREGYFEGIDRGLAWDIVFTDEELVGLLGQANFTLPSSVEKVHLQGQDDAIHANTDTKRAVFNTNLAKFERVLSQHQAEVPQPDKCIDHGRMYLDSAVMVSTPSEAMDSDESTCTAPIDPEHSWKHLNSSLTYDDDTSRIASQILALEKAVGLQMQLSKLRRDESRRQWMLEIHKLASVYAAFFMGLAAFDMWEGRVESALKTAAFGCVELAACVIFWMLS
jgi:hypothetical protein